ncbi:hypothetical protein O3P69_016957 [Scylla paramamosain]|uniref:Uncharacterized protein n=1 Tax=Scylla paramamosain TaxID=85552 RepID=A0AAW0TTP3_SCYPA
MTKARRGDSPYRDLNLRATGSLRCFGHVTTPGKMLSGQDEPLRAVCHYERHANTHAGPGSPHTLTGPRTITNTTRQATSYMNVKNNLTITSRTFPARLQQVHCTVWGSHASGRSRLFTIIRSNVKDCRIHPCPSLDLSFPPSLPSAAMHLMRGVRRYAVKRYTTPKYNMLRGTQLHPKDLSDHGCRSGGFPTPWELCLRSFTELSMMDQGTEGQSQL